MAPDLDLAPARAVSRRHARIGFRDADCWILDLNSAAGTFLNERRLLPGREVLLRVGDRIRIGDQQLTCIAVPAEGGLDEEDHAISDLVSDLWESPEEGGPGSALAEPPDLLDVALRRSNEVGLI